jgi:hypothetical protein
MEKEMNRNTSLDKLYFISMATLSLNSLQVSRSDTPGNSPPSSETNLIPTRIVSNIFSALKTSLNTILATFFLKNILLEESRRHTLITATENIRAITMSIAWMKK